MFPAAVVEPAETETPQADSSKPVKEKEVHTVTLPEHLIHSNEPLAVSALQICTPGSVICNWSTFHPICKRNTPGKVRNSVTWLSEYWIWRASRYVIANDLSASAADVMRKNVEINGLGEQGEKKAKVQVNEGDAW